MEALRQRALSGCCVLEGLKRHRNILVFQERETGPALLWILSTRGGGGIHGLSPGYPAALGWPLWGNTVGLRGFPSLAQGCGHILVAAS